MMYDVLETYSQFFYIDPISENVYLDFDEGGDELTAELNKSSYSLYDLGQEVARALNDAGDNIYTVTLDRSTRKYTISADGSFALRVTTGSHVDSSAFSAIGFTSNKTGASSYESDESTGTVWRPQFLVQDYVPSKMNISNVKSTVNESLSGELGIVTFGQRKIFEMRFRYITDRPTGSSSPIEENSSAISDALDFFNFAINKNDLEFMPDRDDPDDYYIVMLERTPQSGDGTAFKLRPMRAAGFFDSGRVEFRDKT